jgi:hypothetical protein
MQRDLKDALLRVAHKDPGLRRVLIDIAKQSLLEDSVQNSAQLRRQQAARLRDLGRALMISAMKAPRQQLIQTGLLVLVLLHEMDKIAGRDPGLQALKRRMVLDIRRKVLASK